MAMRNKQRGVTFLGWVFLLLPLALLVYVVIRLTPIYLNYMAVSKSVDALKSEVVQGSPVNVPALQSSLGKHLDIEGINVPAATDFKVERVGDDTVGIMEYEEIAPIAGNVSLLVQFKKQVQLN
jgi:hypothetical protein